MQPRGLTSLVDRAFLADYGLSQRGMNRAAHGFSDQRMVIMCEKTVGFSTQHHRPHLPFTGSARAGRRTDADVAISIIDTRLRIPEKNLKRILDPFSR
jgi:hypothetical protein